MIRFIVFTDGGQFRKGSDPPQFDAVSSIRIFKKINEEPMKLVFKDQIFLFGKTGNHSEIHAMHKSLEWIDHHTSDINDAFKIEVYTDSMIYKQSLMTWIYGWMKTAKNGVLYSGFSGKRVENQEEILGAHRIMTKMRQNKNAVINVYHISSHAFDTKTVNPTKVQKAKTKFEKNNNCKINDSYFLWLLSQNRECDVMVGERYDRYKKTGKEGLRVEIWT